jgi:hypothetical protein
MSNLVVLHSREYFLLRHKPTGQVFGKCGRSHPGPASLFTTVTSAKAGLSWKMKRGGQFAISGRYTQTIASDFEIVPVQVEIMVK